MNFQTLEHTPELATDLCLSACTQEHSPLGFPINDEIIKIWGGSCVRPQIEADIYISFDDMACHFEWEYPWQETNKMHIRFFISDYGTPKNINNFKSLILYTQQALIEQKKIHAGCLSGHGRTGLFFSALTQTMMNTEQSAIDYVRDNYCHHAVESLEQILFLHTIFGVPLPKKEKLQVIAFLNHYKEKFNISFYEKVNNVGFHQAWEAQYLK